MKRIYLIIAAATLIGLSAEVASADGTAKPPALPKGPEGTGKVSPATPPHPSANRLPAKPSLLKPALPVDSGKQHGLATVGGAGAEAAHKNAVINGTGMKRSP